jgi:MYXO-CTERM domain-containing protein
LVAVSSDGGASAAPGLTIAGGVLTAFARVPATGSLIAGGAVGSAPVAFRSTDGGASFQPLPTPPHLRALAARGARLYAVADNYADGYAIGTSDDEGTTWQPLMSYARGGTSIAPHAIDAIAACVMTSCRGDCLSRASMSQWAPELCSATLAMPTGDAGVPPRDASADATAPGRDGASDRGQGDGGSVDGRPGGVASSGGCHCQTGGPESRPLGGIVVVLAFARRRRRRR